MRMGSGVAALAFGCVWCVVVELTVPGFLYLLWTAAQVFPAAVLAGVL